MASSDKENLTPVPPPFNRLYDESKRQINPRVARMKKIDQCKEEIEWKKKLEAQHLTVSPVRHSWGCPSQKRVKSPPIRIQNEKRPVSQRLPSWESVKKINDNAPKSNVMTISPRVQRFALPPLDYSNLNSINDKPRSKYLYFYDLLIGL